MTSINISKVTEDTLEIVKGHLQEITQFEKRARIVAPGLFNSEGKGGVDIETSIKLKALSKRGSELMNILSALLIADAIQLDDPGLKTNAEAALSGIQTEYRKALL
jgi:hypothetical protein